MRLATSPAKSMATETRSGRRSSSHIKAKSLSTPQEKDDAVLTMQVDTKTGCPLCTALFILANSMRTHLRQQYSVYRMVRRSKQTGINTPEVSSTGTEDVKGGAARCGMVTNRL